MNAFITGYRERLQDARGARRAASRLSGVAAAARRQRPRPGARPPSPRRRRARRRRHGPVTFDAAQLFAFTPMLILIGMGCVVLLAETFVRGPAAPAWPGWASPPASPRWRRW